MMVLTIITMRILILTIIIPVKKKLLIIIIRVKVAGRQYYHQA